MSLAPSATSEDRGPLGDPDALVVRPPRSREEILAELSRLAAEVERAAGRFDTAAFFTPQMEDGLPRWSAADQVRHLTRSTYPLARAYSLPRFLLLLRFGARLRPSDSYREVAERYGRLLETRPDSGRYAPRPDERRDEERRAEIMAHWRDAVSRLTQSAGTWSERALDRFRLPHPLLGRISAREMLYFTLFHTSHHGRQMARRGARPDHSGTR